MKTKVLRSPLTKSFAAVSMAALTSILCAQEGPPPCWQNCDVGCVCASNGEHIPGVTVPAGYPCAGAKVTLTVMGDWYGPTVASPRHPGNTKTKLSTDPKVVCHYRFYYTCHGRIVGPYSIDVPAFREGDGDAC
jgi:hypothetical protein